MEKIQLSHTEAFAYRWIMLIKEKIEKTNFNNSDEKTFFDILSTFDDAAYRRLYLLLEQRISTKIGEVDFEIDYTTDAGNHSLVDECINEIAGQTLPSINLSPGKTIALSIDRFTAHETVLGAEPCELCSLYDINDILFNGQELSNVNNFGAVLRVSNNIPFSYVSMKYVFEWVVRTLLHYYPIKGEDEGRMKEIYPSTSEWQEDPSLGNRKFGIEVNYYDDTTQIYFMNGTINSSSSTEENLIVNGKLPLMVVINLIDWILKDHDVFRSFHRYPGRENYEYIEMDFHVNITDESMKKGIPCSEISLNIRYAGYEIYKSADNDYRILLAMYLEKVQDTPQVKKMKEDWIRNEKQKILDNPDELEGFLEGLTRSDMHDIIECMDLELFLSLYRPYLERTMQTNEQANNMGGQNRLLPNKTESDIQ